MEVLDWLLHLMSPSVPIFHIEAHTAKGGRGKGCAWVYVRTVANAQELVAMNHCALLKMSLETGQLGAYIGGIALETLCEEDAAHRSTHMPRQLLVAELPSSAAKRVKNGVIGLQGLAIEITRKDQAPRETLMTSTAVEELSGGFEMVPPQQEARQWCHDPYGLSPNAMVFAGRTEKSH